MSVPTECPVTLEVSHDDDHQTIVDILQCGQMGVYFNSRPAFARQEPTGPSAGELAQGPTFAGYPCSPTVDDHGLPTWIIFDGKQAQRREKQGDVWYSVRVADGSYAQVLRIPKGEKPPEVKGR